MAIQRRELPKQLDYDSVIETLFTQPPVSALPSAIGNVSSLSVPNNADSVVNISGIQQQRLLCSTHTSDGTFIVSTLKFDTINIKDAYTTLIYDDVKPRMEVAGSVTGSMSTPAPPRNVCEGRLLALITSTGYCLCYRRNGNLK